MTSASAHVLPARFVEDRIFLYLRTVHGSQLKFFTDTGGGGMFISPKSIRRYGWKTVATTRGGTDCEVVQLPALARDSQFAFRKDGEPLTVHDTGAFEGCDGFLGQSWFADRVWHLDYLDHKLGVLERARPYDAQARACPLGFQRRADGSRANSFPRISAAVDGEVLEFLLDTGATRYRAGGDSKLVARRAFATSFVTTSVFERWRSRHPAWRVVEHADSMLDEPMIEVPCVALGGLEVGPAWFVRRPDKNFHQFMSQWMDRRVDGALGGSVLRYFRVVVDYPKEVAYFTT